MKRTCDGTDPGLLGPDGKTPCVCGTEFDDTRRSVRFPHDPIASTPLVFAVGDSDKIISKERLTQGN